MKNKHSVGKGCRFTDILHMEALIIDNETLDLNSHSRQISDVSVLYLIIKIRLSNKKLFPSEFYNYFEFIFDWTGTGFK